MPRLSANSSPTLALALAGLLVLPAVLGVAAPTHAQTIELREVDNTAAQLAAPTVFPAGFKTFDVLLQNEDPLRILNGAQILLELTQGEIFDLAPSLNPPNDNVGPFDPPFNELTTFDTFAAQGGDRVSETVGTLQVGAGPVNIDGTLSDAILTQTVWAQATNPAGGNDIFGPHEDFLLFRFNTTGNAVGTVSLLAYVGRPSPANAMFDIPEPASPAVFAMLAAAVRRRCVA